MAHIDAGKTAAGVLAISSEHLDAGATSLAKFRVYVDGINALGYNDTVAGAWRADTLQTKLLLDTAAPPASATDTGVAGEIRRDADYIYVCTAANTWARAPISSW